MKNTIQELIHSLCSSFDLIDENRKSLLEECASSISKQIAEKAKSEIIVICTHNSRRSQLAELWISLASIHFMQPSILSFSGGSESTAFNYRMVNALIDIGLEFGIKRAGENPHYTVALDKDSSAKLCFSKVYSDDFNPQNNFIAILVCHSADEACPTIFGAEKRYFVPYVDPKRADDTEQEKTAYSEKVLEIGREMLYMISKVNTESEQSN